MFTGSILRSNAFPKNGEVEHNLTSPVESAFPDGAW